MSFVSRFKQSIVSHCALAALTFTATANAVPIIDGFGRLQGATGVSVQGFTYDVEFVKGVCGDLFSGCDHPLDFAFNDIGSVRAAEQALLDQVFVDADGYLFDSQPGTTMAGCDWQLSNGRAATNTICFIQTPFTRLGPMSEDGHQDRLMRYDIVQNSGSTYIDGDGITGAGGGGRELNPWTELETSISMWARWTQSATSVPEPSSLAIFASALVALAVARRRRQDSSSAA
jgi:hypothetical protein